tara:strand:- start:9790 stop:10470 length:681 start_codon:yes stop_codon:yes gene_type:complete
MSKMPKLNMEIESMTGLAEKEYLKRPELPKSTDDVEEVKPKKKRVVSQKQLDSLKKAREASVLKRKKIREEKEALKKDKPKKEKKPLETIKEESEEEESSEESESSTDEELIEVKKPVKSKRKGRKKIDYDAIINGVVGQLHSRQDEDRGRWRKEWENAEEIRMDERNKLLGLVKQMEVADNMKKNKPKPQAKPQYNPMSMLKPQRGNSEVNWDDCFKPRSSRFKY